MAGNTAAVEGLAGALGGVTALLATYPLMTVQTLQATRRSQGKDAGDSDFTVPLKRRKGTLADVAEVISISGWSGLYRGLKPSLLGTTVSQGIYFYLYSLFRQAALDFERKRGRGRNGEIGVGLSLVVAFVAGCGNVIITNPIWVVATRMQAEQRAGKDAAGRGLGPVGVARDIVDESGVLGLWKGVLPSLIMVSNPTVTYVLYESFTAQVKAWKRKGAGKPVAPSAGDVFAISAAAKLGATVVTYPLQLIKARLQSAGRHTHADRQYSGTLNAIFRIWQTEGFLGFYKGMHTKIVQSILAAALLMAIKEKTTQAALLLLKPPLPRHAQPSLALSR